MMTPLFSGIYLLYRYITNHGEGEGEGDDGRTAFSRYHERDASVRASIGVSAFFFFYPSSPLATPPFWLGQGRQAFWVWVALWALFFRLFIPWGRQDLLPRFFLFYFILSSVNQPISQSVSSAQLSTAQGGGRLPSIYIYSSFFLPLFLLCLWRVGRR